MVMASPDKTWITVAEASRLAGCADSYIRRLLLGGRLAGWKTGERGWNVDRQAAVELGQQLTTRSTRRKAERKSLQPAAKAAKKRRRKA